MAHVCPPARGRGRAGEVRSRSIAALSAGDAAAGTAGDSDKRLTGITDDLTCRQDGCVGRARDAALIADYLRLRAAAMKTNVVLMIQFIRVAR